MSRQSEFESGETSRDIATGFIEVSARVDPSSRDGFEPQSAISRGNGAAVWLHYGLKPEPGHRNALRLARGTKYVVTSIANRSLAIIASMVSHVLGESKQ